MEPIEIIRSPCPSCRVDRKVDVVARYTETDGYEEPHHLWHDVVRCRGCETVFFVMSHDLFAPFQVWKTYPSPSARPQPEWLGRRPPGPPTHAAIRDWAKRIRDFYGCMDADLKVPAAVAARTVFDIACSKLGIEEGLPFERKLDALRDAGLISLADRDNLGAVVEAGHAAAHRGWEPTTDELHFIAGILESFIERVFIQRDAAAEMLARIPTRKPRNRRGGAGA